MNTKLVLLLITLTLAFISGLSAQGNAIIRLDADGSFEKQASGWRPREGTRGDLPIATEDGNRFLTLAVPAGYSTTVLAPVTIPPDVSEIRISFRARCHINPEPGRPVIMFLIGSSSSSKGKPVKTQPDGQWSEQEILVRFKAGEHNRQLSITTVANPLAVDIDDIKISEAVNPPPAPKPKEGPSS